MFQLCIYCICLVQSYFKLHLHLFSPKSDLNKPYPNLNMISKFMLEPELGLGIYPIRRSTQPFVYYDITTNRKLQTHHSSRNNLATLIDQKGEPHLKIFRRENLCTSVRLCNESRSQKPFHINIKHGAYFYVKIFKKKKLYTVALIQHKHQKQKVNN